MMKKNYVKINVPFLGTEKYLPSKRHRKLRTRAVKINTEVKIVEPDDFPIAFIIHRPTAVCEGAKTWQDIIRKDSEYRVFAEEIRAYNGRLYKPVRVYYGGAISTEFETPEHIAALLSPSKPEGLESDENNDLYIICREDVSLLIKEIHKFAKQFVFYDGKFWREYGEPIYEISTLEREGTQSRAYLFVCEYFRPNIALNPNYYNAFQRDEAIAFGMKTAEKLGDTFGLNEIKNTPQNIEVLMPELVRVRNRPEV